MLARRSLLMVLVTTAFVSAAAQRPINPPNYFAFQLPHLLEGEALEGELTVDDGQNFKDGSYLDIYAFDGQSGQRVSLQVTSWEFDPYVSVYDPSGYLIGSNDDYGAGTDAGVDLLLSETGRYLVVVSGYSQLDLGAYTVQRFGRASALDASTQVLAFPSALYSTITSDMPRLVDSHVGGTEYFSFEVSTPAFLVFTMSSWEIDAVLTLYDEHGELIGQNDDYGMGSDARLAVELEPGHYTLAASSYFSGSTGEYSLEARRYVESD